MTFISTKIIQGKKRHYLEKSIRLPQGKVKKFSVYLKNYQPGQEYPPLEEYKKVIEKKAEDVLAEAMVKSYHQDHIFTEQALKKLEKTKQGYAVILRKLTPQQWNDVLDRFTVNFTYESNAIEGNSLTLKDVTFIIKEGKILESKDLREVYETINTRKALAWIMEQKPTINETDIITLHKMLVENTGITIGYKKLPNFLLGRTVKTTPPQQVKKEMDNLLGWYHQNTRMHPLQRAALFHGKFEKIHPFEDGNGRVGRLLINITLLNQGYPPLIIRKTQRVTYFHALDAFDNGHPDNIYYFLLEKYKKTYEQFFKIYLQYLQGV